MKGRLGASPFLVAERRAVRRVGQFLGVLLVERVGRAAGGRDGWCRQAAGDC
jgi:hypothetical protein